MFRTRIKIDLIKKENKILKSIFCIVVTAAFILPNFLVTAENQNEEYDLIISDLCCKPSDPFECDIVTCTAEVTNNRGNTVINTSVRFSCDSLLLL